MNLCVFFKRLVIFNFQIITIKTYGSTSKIPRIHQTHPCKKISKKKNPFLKSFNKYKKNSQARSQLKSRVTIANLRRDGALGIAVKNICQSFAHKDMKSEKGSQLRCSFLVGVDSDCFVFFRFLWKIGWLVLFQL